MDLLEPEKELVARLKDRLGVRIAVEAFPDSPEVYDFKAADGAVLVRYQASTYTTPVANRSGTITQDRTGQWLFSILHRNLREHGGVYAILETVRKALTGYSLVCNPESTILYPIRDSFRSREPQKWIYEIVFAQVAPEVEG